MNNNESFKVFNINIQCLKSKLNLLNFELASDYADVLLLCETWSNQYDVNLYVPQNYVLAASYIRHNSIRGGTSIFCKSNYQFKCIDIPFCIEKIFECCCISIKTNNQTLIFLSVYKSPVSNFNCFVNQFESCLNFLFSKFGFKCLYFLGGDLNINFLCNSRKKVVI